jgi:hypothetical protein
MGFDAVFPLGDLIAVGREVKLDARVENIAFSSSHLSRTASISRLIASKFFL